MVLPVVVSGGPAGSSSCEESSHSSRSSNLSRQPSSVADMVADVVKQSNAGAAGKAKQKDVHKKRGHRSSVGKNRINAVMRMGESCWEQRGAVAGCDGDKYCRKKVGTTANGSLAWVP